MTIAPERSAAGPQPDSRSEADVEPFAKRTQSGPLLSDNSNAGSGNAGEAAGVEFIDENGGGAGVRLRKPKSRSSEKVVLKS